MKRYLPMLAVLTAMQLGSTPAQATEHDTIPAWFKASFLDMREDVQEAAQSGKRLLLYFHQEGCPYCRKLMEDNFGQRHVAETTRRHFDAVAIDLRGARAMTGLDGATTIESAFAASLKVMFTPTILFLDEQGKVVLRLNGYWAPERFLAALEYAGKRLENQLDFRDYLARRSPPPASGKLHHDASFLQPPYRLAERGGDKSRPLLVLFEQRQCTQCDDLHLDVFKRPETRELLGRFDVVQLDMWSDTPVQTPAGLKTTAREWARALGVSYAPTLVFFDRGREVIRAEAYFRAMHIQSLMDYVASGAYREQPSFQHYLDVRIERLRREGVKIEVMK
jgi:thioredoxin-related protein